jgi:hypothetical protein
MMQFHRRIAHTEECAAARALIQFDFPHAPAAGEVFDRSHRRPLVVSLSHGRAEEVWQACGCVECESRQFVVHALQVEEGREREDE